MFNKRRSQPVQSSVSGRRLKRQEATRKKIQKASPR